MMILTTTILAFIALVSGNRNMERIVDSPLVAGDEVIIKARWHTRSRETVRLYDGQASCNGQPAQNLIMKMMPRKGMIDIGRKVGNGCRYVMMTRRRLPFINVGSPYELSIEVATTGFVVKIKVNDRVHNIFTAPVDVGAINNIRTMSGDFSAITTKRFVPLAVRSCGKRYSEITQAITTRITGGSKSKPGQYPWQAAIRKARINDWLDAHHVCGATLIRECWVLTAAHCIQRVRNYETHYLVRVGDYYNLDDGTHLENEHQQDMAIEKVFQHEEYRGGTSPPYDIALIKLKKVNGSCVETSEYANPACLPDPSVDHFDENAPCVISGWGAQSYDQAPSRYPHELQGGKVNIRSEQKCRTTHGTRLKNGMLCAGGDADTCQGDSGGPLACQRDTENKLSPFVVWGITSWGDQCGLKDTPGVYTKVSDYISWITDIISLNSD